MKQTLQLAFAAFVLIAMGRTAVGDKFRFLDLQMRENQKLTKEFAIDLREGNTLSGAPTGEQALLGIKFRIDKGVVHLGSRVEVKRPEKVEGIAVRGSVSKLHILHATQYGGGPNKEGARWHVVDGTLIGEYRINYKDKSTATIPIVYGKDVRDWWFRADEKGVTRGKVAWTGDNDLAKRYDCRLRLYVTSWKNPKPDVEVATIDYISRKKETVASPFCVAITVEKP